MVGPGKILRVASAPLEWLARDRLMRFAFIDQVVASGGNFVTAILLARALGIYELGRFALAWMLLELVATLQYAAVIQPMLNIGPKHADAERRRYDQAVMAQQAAAWAVLGGVVGGGGSAVAWLAGEPALAGLDRKSTRLNSSH